MMSGSGFCQGIKVMGVVSSDIALIVAARDFLTQPDSIQNFYSLLALNVFLNIFACSVNRLQFDGLKQRKWVALAAVPLILPNAVMLGTSAETLENVTEQESAYGVLIVFTSICLASMVAAKWFLHGRVLSPGAETSGELQRRELI